MAGPTPNYPQTNSWSAANSIVMPSHHQQQGSVIIDSQQAVGSQDSSGQFRFLPGQRSSQDSQSTPSLSNRSVPRFLEEAWARGEPQQQGARQAPSMPPPPPPPPPPPGTEHLTAAWTRAWRNAQSLCALKTTCHGLTAASLPEIAQSLHVLKT